MVCVKFIPNHEKNGMDLMFSKTDYESALVPSLAF